MYHHIVMTISINTGPPKKRHSVDEQQCSSAVDEEDGNYMERSFFSTGCITYILMVINGTLSFC